MLSKLAFFEAGEKTPNIAANDAALREAFERHFPDHGVCASPVSGGTLGVCFYLDLAGTRHFLKTHLPHAQFRANLDKEIIILRRLYGNAVVHDSFEVTLDGKDTRHAMLMTALMPLTSTMQPDAVIAMVRDFAARFGTWRPSSSHVCQDFEEYIAHGERAVSALEARALIETRTAGELSTLLKLLRAELDTMPRALCHGDFGPKNIMTDGVRPIAIDWEDAFWGIAGYDYLYWLTFMDNRPFLHNAAFGRTGLEPNIERAILALIVLLKSALSVHSGAYRRHAVPIETRIAEVLDLTPLA